MGNHVSVGWFALLDARGGIEIGNDVNISSYTKIITGSHDIYDKEFTADFLLVKVGDYVWIGTGTIVLQGVTIGEGSVIADGAVVTKDIPPYEVWGGVPAKHIRMRNSNLDYHISKPNFYTEILAEVKTLTRRVLVIIPDLTGGGAERVATNLATCLAQEDDTEVILAVEHITADNYGATVKTVNLNMPKDKGKLKIFWHIKLTRKLKKIKKEYEITHSISFLSEPSLANVLSKNKDMVIVSERNYVSAQKNNILKAKEKWLLKKADKVVALSEMVRQDLIQHFKVLSDKAVTIYNPCYVERILKQSKEEILSKEEIAFFRDNAGKVVITAGRLVDQKGQWYLIRAFSAVTKRNPGAKLIILGQGENKKYLTDLIKELELEDSVFLWGYKDNPYPYLYYADLFAFSSVYEGLGNIIVECMACGLPTVSVDCKFGPKELLNPNSDLKVQVSKITYGEYGVLVPTVSGQKYSAADPLTEGEECLSEAILNLLNNDSLRLHYREKIVERAKDFNPHIITKQWLALMR